MSNIEKIIDEMIEANKELLERLGSDYDENGVPYWEKGVRERIAQEIEALPLHTGHEYSQLNALGMRMMAAKVARGY